MLMPRMKKPKQKVEKLLNELNCYMISLKTECQTLYHRIENDPNNDERLDRSMKKLYRHMIEVSLYITELDNAIYKIDNEMEKINDKKK